MNYITGTNGNPIYLNCAKRCRTYGTHFCTSNIVPWKVPGREAMITIRLAEAAR